MNQIPKAINASTATPPTTPPTIAPMGVDLDSAGIGTGETLGPLVPVVCGPWALVEDEEDEDDVEVKLRVEVGRDELVLSSNTRGVKDPPNVCPE